MPFATPGRPLGAIAVLIVYALLGGCGGGSSATGGTQVAAAPADPTSAATVVAPTTSLSAAAALGEQIFSDVALSASGRQSCGTCHARAFGFADNPTASGPDRGLVVALGGPAMNLAGFRNTPTLMYASYGPAFAFAADGSPTGGFFRDGRAATLAAQAEGPFTNPREMANADAGAVIARLQTRPYLGDFEALYGYAVLSTPAVALARMAEALAAYETEATIFHPFTSKYDFWLKGLATLTALERQGLGLFNDPTRGNCAACHSGTSRDGFTPALFTDFSYDNLGVPRNAAIPANSPAPPADTPLNSTDGVHPYYDLGVCGPFRDNAGKNLSGACGAFKVPTLRDVALTAPYFHNGRFATLTEAVSFYVRRDTNPEEWYPVDAHGLVTKFDDLPALYGGQFVVQAGVPGSDAGYVGNVNTLEIPYNRHIGDAPALDAAEITAVVAFLCTLTDGYDPVHPDALTLPAQCPQSADYAAAK